VKHPIFTAAASALVAVFLMILGLWPGQGAQEQPVRTVALVLDTSIGVNSAVIAQGAQMAAREYGAELTVSALSKTDGPERQLSLIREALGEGASAVLLVPAQESVVNEAVRLCGQHHANLVLLDACESCRGKTPYVGTDHMASGVKAAETLLNITGAKKLLILTSGDQISSERLKGARLAAVRQDAEALVCQVRIVGDSPGDEGVRGILAQHADASAVLCLDGTLTECAARGIGALGMKKKMTLAGFDCDQTHIDCLESGSVRFTVLREPLAVGYEGFKCVMDMMNWEKSIPIEYVDVAVIMREDILKPENVRLVFPLIQ
jgi:ribose transport system substrate-binding protein